MINIQHRSALRLLALSCAFVPFAGALHCVQAQELAPLRPPAVPLVTHDPYFSIWSETNDLNGGPTHHWTGNVQRLTALVRVDGQSLRLMGATPEAADAMPQTGLDVLPTRTIYTFANAQVQVQIVFLTPAIPSDIEVLSRPVTYVSYLVRSLDGKNHSVQFYADAGADLTVNNPDQKVVWDRARTGNLTSLRLGSQDQSVLAKRGDNVRIDWGHLYLTALPGKGTLQSVLTGRDNAQSVWMQSGKLPAADDAPVARAANDNAPVAAISMDLGTVGAAPVSRTTMLTYDDEYSVVWMGHNLRPYWRRGGMDAAGLITVAARDYSQLNQRCIAFDNELMTDLRAVGGEKYARLTALAHRQALAAQKVVADANGAPLMFSKENFSNGSIGTVDVMYPASPQLLLLSPTLMKATLEPIMEYSSGPAWKFNFAPHDVGVYPKANGMLYGGGESVPANGDVSGKMPIEESGNMLLMLGAVSKIEGNTKYADRYWPLITKWANYLESQGYDLDNQLSTDDFAGHLAHNVNLSGKSIEALGAYAMMAQMRGDQTEATRVRGIAQGMSAQWMNAARDGDHYKLAFDKPGTWSQKYNIAWDDILGLNLFPDSVGQTEMAYYKTKLNRYGLPLDSREGYTKLDWSLWSAALTGQKSDVETIAGPIYDFLNDSPSRVPMTDWYRTVEGTQVGFKARSVVGGVFMPVLNDRQIWSKWTMRDLQNERALNLNWAPLPPPQIVTPIVPTSAQGGVMWRYTTDKPSGDWFAPAYDATSWQSGEGGFGSDDLPGATIRTQWTAPDIWMRREFTLTAAQLANRESLELSLYHDDNADVYINGVPALSVGGSTVSYQRFQLRRAVLDSLKPGVNVFALHVRDTGGAQFADMGLVSVK